MCEYVCGSWSDGRSLDVSSGGMCEHSHVFEGLNNLMFWRIFCFEVSSLISDDYLEFKSELKELGRNVGIIFQIQDDILEMSTSSENMGKGTSSDIERKKKTILSSMALDHDKEKWASLQSKIEDFSLEEKKSMLKDYYSNSGIIDRSNEILLNLEKKCKDIIKLLPDTIHNDMNDLLNIIAKRKN